MFDGFWDNVFRYPRYLITIVLGLFLNTFEPLMPLLKRPVTLIAFVGLFGGSLVFLTLTIRAMLGLSTI
jgi:membrane protein insertase Oxa1/YidC/SpoIIIJ